MNPITFLTFKDVSRHQPDGEPSYSHNGYNLEFDYLVFTDQDGDDIYYLNHAGGGPDWSISAIWQTFYDNEVYDDDMNLIDEEEHPEAYPTFSEWLENDMMGVWEIEPDYDIFPDIIQYGVREVPGNYSLTLSTN